MIASFADRDTERLFNRERVRRFPSTLHGVMRRNLLLLDAALALEELRVPPGNCVAIGRGSTASASTNNGASAFAGATARRSQSKS
jgi:plasmid maintenance system killer protein